jgi:amino acid transporter
VVSLSLIAEAFANYAITFLPDGSSALWHPVMSTAIVLLFVAINLRGAKDVAFWERLTVLVKFLVLSALAVTGLIYLQPDLLSPSYYPPSSNIFFSLAVTFFAFEGFRVITNTAEDMPDPATTLPRAMMAAVLIVMLLYVAIAFSVFGNLPVSQVIAAKDFALAQAAFPVFGQIGFTVVTITALIATASAINANLYAVTNVTYQLAKDGELPQAFGEPIAHSREGLVISGILVIVMSLLFDLREIAAIGSISVLFVHAVTHIGHLKIIHKTGATVALVVTALLLCLGAMGLALFFVFEKSSDVVVILVGFLLLALVTEVLLQKVQKREVRSRIA